MPVFPALPEPSPTDEWGYQLNDCISARTNYLVNEIDSVKSHLGLGTSSTAPTGTGREDTYNTSIVMSGGSYSARGQFMTAEASFWLSGARVYTGGGGATMEIVIMGLDGRVWCSETVDTSATTISTPAWFTVTFPTPVYISYGSVFVFGMKPAANTRTWRNTGAGTYKGTLWSSSRSCTNGIMWTDSPGTYNEVSAVGLIEYNS